MDIWHKRYYQLNETNLRKLLQQKMVCGINFKSTDTLSKYTTCYLGKQTAACYPKASATRSTKILKFVH